jgi:hypothetical protein
MALSDAFAAAFPGEDSANANESFRKFRDRINSAAAEPDGPRYALEVDTKRGEAGRRECWFTGPDPTIRNLAEFSRLSVADIEGLPHVESRGVPSSLGALAKGKRVVRFFVSYAHLEL